MAQDFELGGVIIPGASDFAFNYVGARWDRFNDWTHIGSLPQGEWASLPQGERMTITNRLRWLMRNNEYCAALHTTFQTHLGNSTLRSRAPNKATFNEAKEAFWLEFVEGCEVSGLSLEQIEDIIYTELLCAGEIFFLKLKGKIQMVPAEYVFSKTDDATDNGWIQGIQYSATGVPVAYRIGSRDHKGQLIPGETPVPAALVFHVFRRERVEQLRGVPWLHAALKPLRDIDEITNAKVTSVKNQSFLSFAVTKEGGSGMFPNLAETGNTSGGAKATGKPSRNIRLQSGMALYLDKGDSVTALSTQYQSSDFEMFLLSRLRAVGATIGLPLELFLEGYKDSNYSSARATNLAWGRKVRKIRRLIEHQFLQPLQRWASGRARAAGLIKGDRKLDEEVFWGWPAVPSIDEAKEAQANATKLAAGLTTYSAVFAEQNLFWEDEFAQRAREAKFAAELAVKEGVSPSAIIPEAKAAATPAAIASAPDRARAFPGVPEAPPAEPPNNSTPIAKAA